MPRAAHVAHLSVVLTLCVGVSLAAQVVDGGHDTSAVVIDSGDALGAARAAQALFERRRLRHLPLSIGAGGGACDERVGRFCTWYSEGEWYPTPEPIEVVGMRAELLEQLDSLQSLVPGASWIIGQRVWYRSEGGDWSGALSTARRCGSVDPWWCRALEGFALHGLGRYTASAGAFEQALAGMRQGRQREWRIPRWAVDGETRDLLDDAQDDPGRERRLLDRLWAMADPLYLVAGNDRLTAHYSRWTVATIREGARNLFHIRWGADLDQLTIRHGWEMGWERSAVRGFTSPDQVIGHKHPEGRDYMPAGDAIVSPATASFEALRADRRRPRSLYAPRYAPVLLPMQGQLAIFPRGSVMAVVATHFLPEDTTFHAGHGHALPWMDPGTQAGSPDRMGLFAMPVGAGARVGATATGSTEGALMLELPIGDYWLSAESWSPERRRAGRLRQGLVARLAPEDVATLSDLLLLRPSDRVPETLEAAVEHALLRTQIRSGESFAIGWEVAGLGFRPETLRFELSVERTGRGVVRRIGEFLHLAARPRPLALSWEEPGPDTPGHVFRSVNLDLPPLDAGTYEVRLVLHTAGRSAATSTRTFEVLAGR